jgi:hypothetical protein
MQDNAQKVSAEKSLGKHRVILRRLKNEERKQKQNRCKSEPRHMIKTLNKRRKYFTKVGKGKQAVNIKHR